MYYSENILSQKLFMWAVIALIILVPFAIGGMSLAPWVPTTSSDLKRIQKSLHAKKGEKFLEFGCGDGRVSHAIAKQNPDIEVLGIELAFPVFFIAKIRQYLHPLPNLRIKLGSGFSQDFGDFDMIYLFGMPESLAKKIIPKFEKEAQKGTRLISYVFSIQDTEGKVIRHEKKNQRTIHVLTK